MRTQCFVSKGFSLVELMTVLVISGTLIAIAIPSYLIHVAHGRRTDAVSTLLTLQLFQEKHRASHTTYAALSDIWSGTDSNEGYYRLSINQVSATGYTITATAQGVQASDTDCSSIVLTVSGLSETRTPATCWKQ